MLFAHLKRILRLYRLRLRGPSGAQFEFTLAAIAQNLRRLAKIIGRPPPATAPRRRKSKSSSRGASRWRVAQPGTRRSLAIVKCSRNMRRSSQASNRTSSSRASSVIWALCMPASARTPARRVTSCAPSCVLPGGTARCFATERIRPGNRLGGKRFESCTETGARTRCAACSCQRHLGRRPKPPKDEIRGHPPQRPVSGERLSPAAKAASISSTVLALKTLICCPTL
jgi:hypothetical protein